MKTIFEWNILDFDYESEAARQADIDSKQFIPGVSTPIDVDVYYSRKCSFYVILVNNNS